VAGTPGPGRGREADDGFVFGVERFQRLEGFTLSPVAPGDIDARLAAGDRLDVIDVPGALDRRLHLDTGTGLVLYRLVQLFGTPNVPDLEAGADQPPRERTTWRYLFEATYDPVSVDDRPDSDEDDAESTGPGPGSETADEDAAVWETPRECLLAVYDYGTDVSVGIATWTAAGLDDRTEQLPEPEADPGVSFPPAVDAEPFLVGVVQLVTTVVEEPVRATYKEQWV